MLMMKRIAAVLAVLLLMISGMTGCRPKEETIYPHLKAVIVEIDVEKNGVYVKDAEGVTEPLFGERCFIDCGDAGENLKLIYRNLNTGNIQYIAVEDLQEGDEVEMDLTESEKKKALDGTAKAMRLQLMTQRMNT